MWKRRRKNLVLRLAVVVSAAALAASWWLRATADARLWEPAIVAFEERDHVEPPASGAIVFTGSSSVRMRKTLAELFLSDGLHRNGVGYALWTSIMHPVLTRDWRQLAR